jgi:hypothetical protein
MVRMSLKCLAPYYEAPIRHESCQTTPLTALRPCPARGKNPQGDVDLADGRGQALLESISWRSRVPAGLVRKLTRGRTADMVMVHTMATTCTTTTTTTRTMVRAARGVPGRCASRRRRHHTKHAFAWASGETILTGGRSRIAKSGTGVPAPRALPERVTHHRRPSAAAL